MEPELKKQITEELLRESKKYLEQGWSVFPVDILKVPTVDQWGYLQRRLPRFQEIESFIRREETVGLALICGELSNITVFAMDTIPGFELLRKRLSDEGIEPPIVKSGKGYHFYFQYSPDVIHRLKYQLGPYGETDVRNDGGYVVLPPSLHEFGMRYQWLVPPNGPFPLVPSWLAELTHPEPPPQVGKSSKSKVSTSKSSTNKKVCESLNFSPRYSRSWLRAWLAATIGRNKMNQIVRRINSLIGRFQFVAEGGRNDFEIKMLGYLSSLIQIPEKILEIMEAIRAALIPSRRTEKEEMATDRAVESYCRTNPKQGPKWGKQFSSVNEKRHTSFLKQAKMHFEAICSTYKYRREEKPNLSSSYTKNIDNHISKNKISIYKRDESLSKKRDLVDEKAFQDEKLSDLDILPLPNGELLSVASEVSCPPAEKKKSFFKELFSRIKKFVIVRSEAPPLLYSIRKPANFLIRSGLRVLLLFYTRGSP